MTVIDTRRPTALLTVLALTATAAVAGCGGIGGGGGGGAKGSGALTTMGFGLSDEIAESRVDTFRKANPDVKLTITEGSFDEQQFLSAVASGNPPDLVYLDRKLIGTYALSGAVQPLTDCVREHGIDLGQYRPDARAQVTLDDTVYGIPEFSSVRVLYLDETVLTQAGLSADQVDVAEWATLPALATRLARVDGGKVTRIGLDPKVPEFLPMWVRANGGEMISADGRTAKLDDPSVIEAVRTATSLIEAQGGWGNVKSFRDTFDLFGAKNPIARHQIGVWPLEDWFLNQIAKNSPDVPFVVKPFTDRQGKPLTMANGQAWVIPKGAKNPDAACAFARTVTATDTWMAAANARLAARKAQNLPFTGVWTGNVTADKKIFDELYQPSGNTRFDDAVQVIRAAQDAAFSLPASPAGAEFDKAWTDGVNRVLSGQAQPADAMRRAQQEATAALDRASK
ncbi:extracellular solute-binding protein [Micromonospora sp. WMMD987]|uniref:extracellular solute-binding protein n=1 Tax=Micromonospora sp. WMMD987 TaxID=3016089 RepID=UPI002499D355|nr:extracellular solute-binding protein [Micromonospora sp. WMMD987]WFE93006.1 extracellular solute-binding protein [Micromonospora sp. WMMD987]